MEYDVLGTPQAPSFGLDTFGDLERGPDGEPVPHPEAIRQVVAEAVLADEVGLDFFGVGEHHRPDFAISAPDVVLAAIAGQTSRIRLGTSVTVLSSDDPIRVFQRFSTLDAVSGGRAEMTLGRGSFTESFPLFGLSLDDYEVLFSEKLDLLAQLLKERPVTWEGTTRPPLTGVRAYPRTAHGLPAWVGVGGTPESVVRAASYGLPLVVAVIGGSRSGSRRWSTSTTGRSSTTGTRPGRSRCTARVTWPRPTTWPASRCTRTRPRRSPRSARSALRAYTPAQFEENAAPTGSLFVGSPETVAQKIAWAIRTLGLSRFQLKYAVGTLPHAERLESIRLYGTEVVPRVRELLRRPVAD